MANDVMGKTHRGEMPETYQPLTPEQRAKTEARRVAKEVVKQSREIMEDKAKSAAVRHAAAAEYRQAKHEAGYKKVEANPEMPVGMKDPQYEDLSLEEFVAFERWNDKQRATEADRLAVEADHVAAIKFHDAGLARAKSEALKEYEATPRATEAEVDLVMPIPARRPVKSFLQNLKGIFGG